MNNFYRKMQAITVPLKVKRIATTPAARKTLIGAVIFLVIFSVAGFFIAPPIIKSILIKKLSETLHRSVAIRQIKVNPFVLSVTVQGFSIKEKTGKDTFISFDELYLNLESMSVLRRGFILSEVKIIKPYVNIVRNQDGSYNFSDLLKSEGKPQGEKETKKPKFSLSNIQIVNGGIDFHDGPKRVAHTVRDMHISLPFISSLPSYVDIYVQPSFEATVNGKPVSFKGKTKPFKDSYETLFEINIKNLDLTYYLSYSPVKIPFKMPSGFLDVNANVSYSQYRDKPPAVTLTGTAVLKDISVVDLKDDPILSFPVFGISGISADLAKQELVIGKIASRDGRLKLKRYQDGKLNLQTLIPASSANKEKPQTTKPESNWSVELRTMVIDNYTVQMEDLGPQEPVKVVAEQINLKCSNLSTAKNSTGDASLTLVLNKKGSVSASGSIGINPPVAQIGLEVKGVEVMPFQSYFTDRVNIIVTKGNVSLNGEVSANYSADGAIKTSYKGRVSLANFASVDKTNGDDFLKWNSLRLDGIDVGYSPLYVNIRQVALTDFYSRLIVNKDGSLNLQEILKGKGEGKGASPAMIETVKPVVDAKTKPEEAAAKEGFAESEKPVEPAPPKPSDASKPRGAAQSQKSEGLIKINVVTLQGGTINFLDRHIEPSYFANLLEIGGRVSGLSSEESKFADVELRGKLENYAPLIITGKINPLRNDLFVDLKVDFKDMDLSPVTPYSGRYLGYTIQKGRLSLNLQYFIEKRKLDSQNKIFIDQFTFGDKVESPDATKLPVSLAIALLKNRKGEIDLDIPVSGYIDDPKFSIWGILLKIIVNLLEKAATSPFALLGAVFGHGEELSYVEFDYGSPEVDEQGLKKLDILTKALFDRPALKLEIEGHVDVDKDKEGLKQYLFRRKLKAQKLKDMVKKGQPSVSLDEIKIEKDEYSKYLKLAYREEDFPKPRNIIGLAKDLPDPEMEKLMLSHLEIKPEDLRQLASQRALKIKEYMLKSGQVTPERVFLLEPKSLEPEKKEKLKNSRVDFKLK